MLDKTELQSMLSNHFAQYQRSPEPPHLPSIDDLENNIKYDFFPIASAHLSLGLNRDDVVLPLFFETWQFFHAFSHFLKLYPFSFTDYMNAFLKKNGIASILKEIFMQLLNVIMRERALIDAKPKFLSFVKFWDNQCYYTSAMAASSPLNNNNSTECGFESGPETIPTKNKDSYDPLAIQGSWYSVKVTKQNWSHLLFLCLKEWANERNLPGFPLTYHPKDSDPLQKLTSFSIQLKVLIVKFLIDLAMISQDLKSDIESRLSNNFVEQMHLVKSNITPAEQRHKKALDAYTKICSEVDNVKTTTKHETAPPALPKEQKSQEKRQSLRRIEILQVEIKIQKQQNEQSLKTLIKEKENLYREYRNASKSETSLRKQLATLMEAIEYNKRIRLNELVIDKYTNKVFYWFDNPVGVDPSFEGDVALLPWAGRLFVNGPRYSTWGYVNSINDTFKSYLFGLLVARFSSTEKAQKLLSAIIASMETNPDQAQWMSKHLESIKRPPTIITRKRRMLSEEDDEKNDEDLIDNQLLYKNHWA